MTSEQITQIEAKLHYSFVNKDILACAFIHSSYGRSVDLRDNERMEFLGDALLDFVVSEYLYDKYIDREVGDLSTMRANIVSASGLRPVVDDLDLIKYLQVGFGADDVKRDSKKIESNLYEAIVAAIFLDGGYDAVKNFILRTLYKSLSEPRLVSHKDSKTLLQEYCQKRKIPMPQYKLSSRSGTDNNPTYTIDLYIDNKYECSGQGHSKKDAEQDAAKKLVTKWRIDSALS